MRKSMVLTLGLLAGCGAPDGTHDREATAKILVPPNVDRAAGAPAGIAAGELSCTAPIGGGDTFAALEKRFGGDAVREMLDGPEGEQYEALVLWPRDPARRIELTTKDDGSGTLASATIADGSRWTVDGIGPGTGLAALERANERPFALYGFEWDYGGLVADWRGGILGQRADGCFLAIQLAPREGAEVPRAVSGDGEIASDLPALAPLGVHIGRMTLSYPN